MRTIVCLLLPMLAFAARVLSEVARADRIAHGSHRAMDGCPRAGGEADARNRAPGPMPEGGDVGWLARRHDSMHY
jgi:hypothetical protein